jgi:hypothetical protein
VVSSPAALMRKVKSVPGAIGYIRSGAANGLVTVNRK